VNPIIAVDTNDDRLALASEFGATHTINAMREDIPARVKEIVPRGVRYVFDNTGLDSSWRAAARSLGMGGTLATVAVPPTDILEFRAADMIETGSQFKFILAGAAVPRLFLPQLITWYRQGRFPYDRLVTTFDFADINAAFAASRSGQVVKPVLLMS
jgi:aryl-alcohol dehydrogenase